ncbi:hypothetical protein AB6A40_007739 [Gnathostoma spinigerum]|uniref:Uncharacterized protein n=1 Tax=Gnathostoma spinigerum TaxID=75299 RepID=A0ABD6EXP4_9BILA
MKYFSDIQDNVVKDDNVATVTSKSTTISESQCPKRISSAMQVGELLFLFHGDKVWKVKGGQVENGPIDIDEIFPEAGAVNVSVSVGNLTFIIHNRTIYGYNYFAAIDTFRIANGWPKVLHDHVLFSPKAVFPLSNGSVVLTSNEAFVTYDLVSNRPISIGDLNRFFPNLPEDLNSGILTQPDSDDILRFFTTDQVVDYNSRIHQTISSQPLAVFVACQ